MKWARVSIDTSREYANALAATFREAGTGGALEEYAGADRFASVRLTAYIPCDESYEAALSRIRAQINAFGILGIDLPSTELRVEQVEEEDWASAWKKYYKPFRLGRFVIKPGWEEYTPAPGETVLELDPGMAFGTGQHPTTALCMGALESYIRPGDTVVDAGTGSGILAIAAALSGAGKVYAFDCDRIAVDAARANFERLGLDINLRRASDAGCIPEKADLVLANIIAAAILFMADSLAAAVKPGGLLAVSGIIEHKARETLEALTGRGFSLVEKRAQKEWVCYILRKNI
ncbi:MAG: 50S ribosomal protein L11 methyltransferase [Abditibacteriota bacterium]|nr:50S ribosomal protein L11 methyltransferase [Abditibacteriota bacterium]